MGDPRKTVAFDGVNEERATYKSDNSTILYDRTKISGSAQVGLAVSLSGDDTVQLASDGEAIEGKLLEVFPDNTCTVQTAGYPRLPAGASAAVNIGRKIVGALGPSNAKGYVRAAAAATGAHVQGTLQDALNGRGAIINNDDTTKLVCRL
jgi:hypothetical protein